MQCLWLRWLRPAASTTTALALALALSAGYARADDSSDSSDRSNASARDDADDSDSQSDRDRDRREDRDRDDTDREDQPSRRNDPHHQAALGVMLYQNSLDIRRVIPDSPAADAGLRRGDELLTVNGDRVKTPEQLINKIRRQDDDARIRLGVLRNGDHRTVTASLSSRDEVFSREDRRNAYNDQNRMLASRSNRQYSRDPYDYDRSYQAGMRGQSDYGRDRWENERYAPDRARSRQMGGYNQGYYDDRGYANDQGYYDDRGYNQSNDGPQGDRGQYGSNRGYYDSAYGRAPENYREEDDRFAHYRRNRQGALGVTLDEDARGPVRIIHIYRDGPADDAGLRPGDEIEAVDGRQVRGADDLLRVLASKRPDEEIRLDVDRDGRQRTFHATLGRPNEVFAAEEEGGYRTSRAPGRGYDEGYYDNGSSRGYSSRGARGDDDNRRD